MEKIKSAVNKHPELFTILGLCVVCYLMFFHNIGGYALMDVDETRYASMARDMFLSKDFWTLRLNGEYFFEKPPLYFWLECLSFAVFGKINEFTVRFPAALCGTASVFLLYFMGKKVVSRGFGVMAALILAASVEFTILAKFAILDITVATCIGFSVFFGFMTFYVQERNKKYFWWLFYIFSGLAILAKGIPGFAVPFGVMFCASIALKKFKEIFRPQYFIPGIIAFLLIVLPWHMLMMKMYGQEFWHEYFVKHHFQRFLNSEEINRKQPFYFYILTFLWGFLPWIVPVVLKIKQISKLMPENKFLYLNVIGFVFTFVFFSLSSTKLITYILPVYFFSACIAANVVGARTFAICTGVMVVISAFVTKPAFKFDFAYGQNDLMHYAEMTKGDSLASFGMSRKYSLIYYHGGHVDMQRDSEDFGWLEDKLKNSYVVIKNKDVEEFASHAAFEVVETGKKYSLIKGKNDRAL